MPFQDIYLHIQQPESDCSIPSRIEASTKHAQTIGMLDRTHATIKTHSKAATVEIPHN